VLAISAEIVTPVGR